MGISQSTAVGAAAEGGARLAALFETTKPRITRLVSITALVGFALGAMATGALTALGGASPRLWIVGLGALLGTALCASGANTLNQWAERRRDALMPRTRIRPLPSGRLAPPDVLRLGVVLGALGAVVLAITAGPWAAIIGVGSLLLYVFLYTPLKPITTWCTLAGAVPGALPPVIGWAAAMHLAGPSADTATSWLGGWSLFLVMLIWQMPHFWAIAWMYRDDYAAGGFRVLPVVDQDGSRTARSVRLWGLALLPGALAPAWALPNLVGPVYVTLAVLSGLAFAWICLRLAEDRSRDAARRVFLFSILHLPLLLGALVADAAWTALI